MALATTANIAAVATRRLSRKKTQAQRPLMVLSVPPVQCRNAKMGFLLQLPLSVWPVSQAQHTRGLLSTAEWP